jgi:hypothetical protein
VLTADQAREWLRKVLADRDLVGQYWEPLVRLDTGLKLRPPLIWAAYLAHRDGIMAEPDVWALLNDGLRLQMVMLDDGEVDQLVDMIVGTAIAHYGQPVPDDDDGDWTLRDRDSGRFLTKDEAVERIIGHVIAGDRQDILDTLAGWDDSFKTMSAAVPLESETATRELVRSVVKDIVAQGYSEAASGGDWSRTETKGGDQ